MNFPKRNIRAISRAIIAVIVIVIIIIAAGGAYLAFSKSSSTTTSTSSSSSSSSQSSSVPPASSTSSSSSSSVPPVSSSSSSSTPSTSSSSSSTGTSSGGQELVVDEGSAPSSEDPAVAIDNNGLETAQNTHVPLTFCANPSCTTLIPVLATSWNESTSGLTYTFNLRSGVYYSNNYPFNAYVVWYNVYRDLIINQPADFIFYAYMNASGVTVGDVNSLNNAQNSPGTNSTLLSIMQSSTGYHAVTVVNATEVQFHLTNAFVAFLQSIDTAPWVFVDPYVVQQHGGVVANTPNSYMSVNGTMVGNGPYVMQSYVPNQYSMMVANPHYWAQSMTSNLVLEPAKIHTVLINYKTDELTRTEDLQTGKSQASIVSFNDINSTVTACKNCYIPNTGTSGSMEWINIDSLKAPTNNTLVRQAMIEAINVSQIQSVVYDGYAQKVIGPMPSIFNYYNSSIQPLPYNVTNAKKLLAQAGYPNGQGFPTITLDWYTSAYASLVVQIVKQDLAQIGINVQTQEVSQATMVTIQATPGQNASAADMVMINWTYYPDFSAYEFIVDSALGAFGNFHNQTILNLIYKSNTELSPTARAQDISQITSDLVQQAGFIWLGQDLDVFDPGAGIGPTIWNHCASGMWYNTAFNGVDFNNVTITGSCT
jgi:ABC-type transport system substrate-binding protein